MLERIVFGRRALLIGLFAAATVAMGFQASRLRVDAGFKKLLPLEHPYMQTFVEYQEEFGGANRVLIALVDRGGDIFNAAFFEKLKAVTDEVFFMPGVDRTKVRSIYTPNVRFIEIVEGGFAGGNVIPAGFDPASGDFETVRANILKSGQIGRLVAADFSSAIVSAELLEIDPKTGKKLDYVKVSGQIESKIREKHASPGVSIHVIGFAKVIGDIAAGAKGVVVFFLVAFAITALLVYWYTQSARLTVLPLVCSMVAVVWQLGLLPLLGYGIDPMSILVPFLIFAIGVSHGVQMISAFRSEVFQGSEPLEAAKSSFRSLLVPGFIALASDTIGFLTILLIKIDIIREMAVTASLGVAVIIFTNLFLLPVLLSFMSVSPAYRKRVERRWKSLEGAWRLLSRIAEPRPAMAALSCAAVLAALGVWRAKSVRIGDLHQGVPELRQESRYNVDTREITSRFSIGVDILTVIAETEAQGCTRYPVMDAIDRFAWRVQNVPGVQSAVAMPTFAKVINAGWNEGSLKWRALSRNEQVLVQSISRIDTDTGLLNTDCSVIPILIFTEDHRAETIDRIVSEVKRFSTLEGSKAVRFRLATGNVGVMAATNEAVDAAQFPMLFYVYAAIIALVLLTFRSARATLCIVAPLALVSVLSYALMALLQIGLKVSTLPVVALGAGIGVDYGIYIFSRFRTLYPAETSDIREAFRRTLALSGQPVIFTAGTLAIGVSTWIFSDLKFQADMGVLLTFMFLVNALGALILLPALATWLFAPPTQKRD
jgi:predicted RND superfamily exporter protein